MNTEPTIQSHKPNSTWDGIRLEKQVIVLTGAYGSLGTAIAYDLVKRGAQLVLLGRRAKPLNQLSDAISKLGYPTPQSFTLDFRDLNQDKLNDLLDTLCKCHTTVHGLVHAAAMLGILTSAAHYPPALWQEVQQVNVTAPILLTQGLLPLMQAAEHASIIMTATEFNNRKIAYWGAFAIAQASQNTFFKLISDELAHTSIAAHQVIPMHTKSRLRAQALPAEDTTPLQEPSQLAPLYSFLLEKKSNTISGLCHKLVNPL